MMVRILGNPAQILKPGESGATTPGGAGGFLGDIRKTIAEFKELMKVANELKGMGGLNNPNPDLGTSDARLTDPGQQRITTNQGGNTPGMKEFVGMLVAQGYGDTPIGTLLDQVRPLTINQLSMLAKSKGVKGARSGK